MQCVAAVNACNRLGHEAVGRTMELLTTVKTILRSDPAEVRLVFRVEAVDDCRSSDSGDQFVILATPDGVAPYYSRP